MVEGITGSVITQGTTGMVESPTGPAVESLAHGQSGIVGPTGIAGGLLGVQYPIGPQAFHPFGHQYQGPPTGAIYSDATIPQNIEKLSLKTGDILIVYYPEQLEETAVRDIIMSLQRFNKRLKAKGIDLTDILLFKEGIKVSVFNPGDEQLRSADYRRIELE